MSLGFWLSHGFRLRDVVLGGERRGRRIARLFLPICSPLLDWAGMSGPAGSPLKLWHGLHGMLCLFCGLRFHSWPDLIEHFERRHGRVVFP